MKAWCSFNKYSAFFIVALLSACTDSGDNGQKGAPGDKGFNSIIVEKILTKGNSECFNGGMEVVSGIDQNRNSVLDVEEVNTRANVCLPTLLNNDKNFNRIASFAVCEQINTNCNHNTETVAEILAATQDGMTVVYTDSPQNQVGFVNIADPHNPILAGTVKLSGEPTSVGVKDGYALVAVNTSTDYVNASGELTVVDINTKTIVRSIDVGGQPDSIAVSPDGQYAAIVIENERNEDLLAGKLPQLPAGSFVIVRLTGTPATWTVQTVSLIGLAKLYGSDPEPEFVDINSNNVAVVTLQENNHIVLIDLSSGRIVNHFSAGTVDLEKIDTVEEKAALILQTNNLKGVRREPDGVTWLSNDYFVTANEGDFKGGSRGFTVFNTKGNVVYDSDNSLDHFAARFGHYPDKRSGNKGSEPENAKFATYKDERFLFVNAERAGLVFVYDMADFTKPVFKQALPVGNRPEGGFAITSRNLFIAASEKDERDKQTRAVINIYTYENRKADYPTIQSVNRQDSIPIPWGALSGLAASQKQDILYAVEDGFYQKNRLFTINVKERPAILMSEQRIVDTNNILAAVTTVSLMDKTVKDTDISRRDVFDEMDLVKLINSDKTVNIDPEAIALASDGGFWIASEGAGSVGDLKNPVNSHNLLFKLNTTGVIEKVIPLPADLNNVQLANGIKGIAEYAGSVYVAFQRVWPNDTNVRIGIYDIAKQTWEFLFYPLDAPASQNGGWVGLSALSVIGNGLFLVVEGDNQAGPDAAIKRVYSFDVTGLPANSLVTKTLVRDLIVANDLTRTGGTILEKIEGLAIRKNGDVLIVNDNEGVDNNSGETQLINLGNILQ